MQLFLKQNMWEKLLAFWKCIVRMVLGQPSKSDTQVWTWDCILSVEKVVMRCHHFQLVWSMWTHPSLKGHLGFEMKIRVRSTAIGLIPVVLFQSTSAKIPSVPKCAAQWMWYHAKPGCRLWNMLIRVNVHAPTLYVRSNIHNYKYTLTLSIFYVLQTLRVLVPISSCFSTVLLTDVLNELRKVTTPGKS